MGASDWHYAVDHQGDVKEAFADLQKKILAEGNYYTGFATFDTFADLEEAWNDGDFWEEGTHSILDMREVVGPDKIDEVAAIRILRDDEILDLFGTNQPTTADFDRFLATDWWVNRWEGRTTPLYRDGQPSGFAFWGISGD
jgi:hypothetical protein